MIAPGTILQNRYLVEEQIGQGGMGAVFVATDQRFGSRVALKETFFEDPNLRKAFEREARLLNRLRHHALPRVSDHFTEEEGQFLVMEYIPGEDLAEMLRRRSSAFPLNEALDWADQLLDALDYLHTQEPPVIHRDIKPQNLKLTARNQIVLLDFGLAKGTPLQTRATATGSVLGYSLNYAPLEQMQGAGTDPRSDIYSLGATLYHLTTGTTPPDALTRATAVLNGEPDPLRPASEVNPQVPAAVAAVFTRAMSQSAARRFASAAEMREALRQAGRDVSAGAGAATGFAPTITVASEQETRLMDAAGGAHLTEGVRPKETEAGSFPDAPTVTDKARTAPAATPAATGAREADSVVTRLRASQPVAARGGRARRAGLIAAGVVILAVVSAGVYSFTRRAPAPQSVAPPSAETVAPSNAPVEGQPQTAEAPSPTPAAPSRSNTAARSAPKEKKSAGGAHTVVTAPEAPQPPPPDAEDAPHPQAPGNHNARMTREELQAILQRVAEERRRAMQKKREAERERRRRRNAPPPPPYP